MSALISNIAAAEIALSCYGSPPSIVGPSDIHPIRVHFMELDDVLYAIPEGSRTPGDWRDNFDALARLDQQPKGHPTAGLVHGGFLESSLSVKDLIKARVAGRPYAIIGHSRGGAQALVLGALLADDGVAPLKVYLIEPARAFLFRLPDALKQFEVWGCWNGNDPVPHLPPIFEQPILQIIGKPTADPFECHHLANVIASLKGN